MFKIFVLSLFSIATAVEFEITNKEIGPIWVGILGNVGNSIPANGGFILGAGATV